MSNRKLGRLFDRMSKKKMDQMSNRKLGRLFDRMAKKTKKMEDSYGYGSGYGFMVSGMVYGLRVL